MKSIKLTKNKFTLVDDEDFEYLNQFKWYASNHKSYQGYAARTTIDYLGKNKYDKRLLYMHREIMNAKKGEFVDRINGDTLNNQKINLRIATPQINARNRTSTRHSSKYFGVHKHSVNNSWIAQIKFNKKTKHLGSFKTQELAKEARDKFIKDNKLKGYRV